MVKFSLTGSYDTSRLIAVGGANISEKYYKTISGASINQLLENLIFQK